MATQLLDRRQSRSGPSQERYNGASLAATIRDGSRRARFGHEAHFRLRPGAALGRPQATEGATHGGHS